MFRRILGSIRRYAVRHRRTPYSTRALMTLALAPDHTKDVFDVSTFPSIVKWVESYVRQYNIDGLLVCGHSGLMIAGAVSYVTKVPVIAVRKKGEKELCRAGGNPINATLVKPADRWAWIDDCISTGHTARWAIQVAKENGTISTVVPTVALLYAQTQRWMDPHYSSHERPFHLDRDHEVPAKIKIPAYGWRT